MVEMWLQHLPCEQLVKKYDEDVDPQDIWHTWQIALEAMWQIPVKMYESF